MRTNSSFRHTWISGDVLQSSQCYYCLSPVLNYCMLCVCMCGQVKYKSRAKDLLKSGCNELLRPDILTALYQSTIGSKVNSHRAVNHGNADLCPQTGRKNKHCEVLKGSQSFICSSSLFLDRAFPPFISS